MRAKANLGNFEDLTTEFRHSLFEALDSIDQLNSEQAGYIASQLEKIFRQLLAEFGLQNDQFTTTVNIFNRK